MSGVSATIRKMRAGHIRPIVNRFKTFPAANPELYGGYMKNAIVKLPHLVFFSPFLVLSVVYMAIGYSRLDPADGKRVYMPYKARYTVIRPDDERMRFVSKDSYRALYERSDEI